MEKRKWSHGVKILECGMLTHSVDMLLLCIGIFILLLCRKDLSLLDRIPREKKIYWISTDSFVSFLRKLWDRSSPPVCLFHQKQKRTFWKAEEVTNFIRVNSHLSVMLGVADPVTTSSVLPWCSLVPQYLHLISVATGPCLGCSLGRLEAPGSNGPGSSPPLVRGSW